jgi:hypothetical protein
MTKATNKHIANNQSLQLSTDEPWDMMKAQILVKISAALDPQVLDIMHYDLLFHITRILPKPGMALKNDADYDFMIQHARNIISKDPTINISIIEKAGDNNKENKDEEKNEACNGKSGKRVRFWLYLIFGSPNKHEYQVVKDPAILPGNLNKNANIQSLHEEWRCMKSNASCPGTHCYVDSDSGEHLPLNHEHFDCWASAMVCTFHLLCPLVQLCDGCVITAQRQQTCNTL